MLTWRVANLFGLDISLGKSKKLKGEFTELFTRIQEHTQWIDTEAFVGLHLHLQSLTTRNHQEILSNIRLVMASPPPVPATVAASATYRLLPHVANSTFFGREYELKRLHDIVIPHRQSKLSITSIIGAGGVGKSQLALQFAYLHMNEFSAVFWVTADAKFKISQAYEDIAVELGLTTASNGQGSLDSVVEVTKKWLKATGESRRLLMSSYSANNSHRSHLAIDIR